MRRYPHTYTQPRARSQSDWLIQLDVSIVYTCTRENHSLFQPDLDTVTTQAVGKMHLRHSSRQSLAR